MALDNTDRQRVWRGLMRYWSATQETVADINKVQLMAAVVATDDWIEANQASYNAALPQPFKGNATAVQKTLIFCAVAMARVSIGALRRLFGEVD